MAPLGLIQRRRVSAVGVCVLIFAAFYALFLRRVGLGDDDAWIGAEAWRVLAWLGSSLRAPAQTSAAPAFLTHWTVHHGPGELYLTLPFLLAGGPSRAALISRNAFFASAALAATYRLALQIWDDRAAMLACLALATSPCFVVYSAVGIHSGLAPTALCLIGSSLLLDYARSRDARFAHAAAAALSAALACRSTVAGLLLGLGLLAAIFARRLALAIPPQGAARRRFLAILALVFSAFQAPFALYWIVHARVACAWAKRILLLWPEDGRILTLPGNLAQRLTQLKALLDGNGDLNYFARDASLYSIGGTWAILLAAAGTFALLELRGKWSLRRALPFVVPAGFLAASTLSPTLLRPYHLFLILPFLYAAAFGLAAAAPPRLAPAALLLLSGLAAWRGAAAVSFFARLDDELARTGGYTAQHSICEKDLSTWLERRPGTVPVVFGELTSGLPSIAFRSRGKIVPIGVPFPEPGGWRSHLSSDAARLIFDATESADPAMLPFVRAQASRIGRRLTLVEEIRRPDGHPVFAIYRASRS